MTASQYEAYASLDIAKMDQEILDVLQHGPLGNYKLGDILGRTQGTISGALSRLRTLGLVYDTGDVVERVDSGNNETVWGLGDDSVEWLVDRIDTVMDHAVELEKALRTAIMRRKN